MLRGCRVERSSHLDGEAEPSAAQAHVADQVLGHLLDHRIAVRLALIRLVREEALQNQHLRPNRTDACYALPRLVREEEALQGTGWGLEGV
eukprot:326005-Pyramimonas_sp.AAC.1